MSAVTAGVSGIAERISRQLEVRSGGADRGRFGSVYLALYKIKDALIKNLQIFMIP